LRHGDAEAAENLYREAIRVQPNDGKLYTALGNLLFEAGASDKSFAAFMSFPGLKPASEINRVTVSNYAYGAGMRFYRAGEPARAIPLLRVAANLNTGSGASILSGAGLRLLDSDYRAAAGDFLACARRYDSPHAYRDYFGLLHAMGLRADAWEGFRILAQRDDPSVWETALVGHRLDAASEGQIHAWLMQEPMRNAGVKYPYAAMYMTRAGTIDRLPTARLTELIADLERPVWKVEYGLPTPKHDSAGRVIGSEAKTYVAVIRESRDGLDHLVVGPDAQGTSTLARGILNSAKKVRVKSDHVYFAEAYRALQERDFDGARISLQEASMLYDLRNLSTGYLLPYYAFAAARSGSTLSVDALLESFPVSARLFDYQLAKAVLLGVAGKHDEALRHLNLARHRRPLTGNRPVYTEYEFAELCQWLFEATGSKSYRDLALEWARKNQIAQPWFAWAYAIEAQLSRDPQARHRAMAMAHYLDRNSYRLSRLSRTEVDAAVRQFSGRNPFLRPKAPGNEQQASSPGLRGTVSRLTGTERHG